MPGETNEIPMVATLLGDLTAAGHDPAAMVFTLDALHTQHATARLLHDAGAGYVLSVKGNQPCLRNAIIDRLHEQQTATTRQHCRGHARTEERILRVTPADEVDFPGAAQVFRVIRHTGGLDGQRTRKEIVHRITNLPPDQADPARLATLVRGHWSIENKIHWVRRRHLPRRRPPGSNRQRPGHTRRHPQRRHHHAPPAGEANIPAARRAASLNPRTIVTLFHRAPNPDKVRYDGALVFSRR